MNDSDIEQALRRYRPVGPPSHLRERILSEQKARRTWPWIAAAAALLFTVLTFRIATRQQVDVFNPQLGSVVPGDLQDDLIAKFGDDASGQELVSFLLREEADRE